MPPKRTGVSKAPEPNVADFQEDWSRLSTIELRQELDRRGLGRVGIRAVLVNRLQTELPSSKARRALRARSPDIEIEGPTAEHLIINKWRNEKGEKRLRPFVPVPDDTYKSKLKKLKKDRMFLIEREKSTDTDGFPCEKFSILGGSGSTHQITIGRRPNCECMDAKMRGNKCKHINYSLVLVLKAPAHLSYQLAFLSEEVEMIFARAPRTSVSDIKQDQDEDGTKHGPRQVIDDQCTICFLDFKDKENITSCKHCGDKVHDDCFAQLKISKYGGQSTCVYCGAQWESNEHPSQEIVKQEDCGWN